MSEKTITIRMKCPECGCFITMLNHAATNLQQALTAHKTRASEAEERVKVLEGALEQQIRTYESVRKYNKKGDAQNMYEIATQALKGIKEKT